MASSDLSIRILAQNLARAALGEVDQQLGALDMRLKDVAAGAGMFGGAISAGITAPLALAAKQAVETAADYEASLNIFQAVSGATADQMAEVGKLAKELGADLTLPATSAGDAAKAMTELAKGGLSVDEALAAAKGTLQLSAAGALSNAEAAEIAANALNTFGISGEHATQVADLLAATANASSVEVKDVADAYKMAGAVFSAFQGPVVGAEQAMADLTTAIGLMGNAGIKGSDAGTSLKQMLLQLTGPSDKAKDAMRALAIAAAGTSVNMQDLTEAIDGTKQGRGEALQRLAQQAAAAGVDLHNLGDIAYDAAGNMRPLKDIVEITAKATAGMTDEARNMALTEVFGADATRAIIVLMKSMSEEAQASGKGWDAMAEAVSKGGAAADLAGARMKGLSGAFEGLKSQWETLLLTVAEPFLPVLTDIVEKISGLVSALIDMDPNLRNAALAFAGVIAAAGPVALAIGGAAAAFTMLNPAVAGVIGVLAAVTAATAGLAALYAGDFLGLRTQVIPALGEFKDAVVETIGHVVETFQTMSFGDALGTLTKELLDWAAEVRPKIIAAVVEWAGAFTTWIPDAAGALFEGLGDLLSKLGSWIDDAGPEIEQAIIAWQDAFIDWVIEAVPKLFEALGDLLGKIGQWISGPSTTAIEDGVEEHWAPAFVEWVADVLPKIASRFAAIVEKLLELIGHAAGRWGEKIAEVWIPAFLDWIGDAAEQLPGKLGELSSAIGEWITQTIGTIGDQAKQIGTAIVQGIASGLVPTALFDKARELATGAISAMQDAIQSHSPSRLAQQLVGEPIVQGIIAGLASKEAALTEEATAIGIGAVAAVVAGAQQGAPQIGAAFGEAVGVALAGWADASKDGQLFVQTGSAAMGQIASGINAAAPATAVEMQAAAVKAAYEAAAGFGGDGGAAVVAAATTMGSDAADGFKKGTDAMVSAAKGAIDAIKSIWATPLPSDFWNAIPQPGSGGSFSGNQPGQGQYQTPTVTPSPGMPPAVQIPNSGGFYGTPGFGGYNPQPVDFGLSDFLGAAYSALITTVQAQNPGMVLMWGEAAQQAFDAAARGYYAANAGAGDIDSLAQGFANAFSNAPWLNIVPAFASGGIVTRPTLGLLGEAGPEAVIPLSRGGRMGGDVHVHFHGPVYGVLDFEQRVKSIVREGAANGAFRGVLTI